MCPADEDLLAASIALAETLDPAVLIKIPSDKVNWDGGTAGMRRADFVAMVRRIADGEKKDRGRIVFGGGHLGPQDRHGTPPEWAIERT